jgi:hypothetical protein
MVTGTPHSSWGQRTVTPSDIGSSRNLSPGSSWKTQPQFQQVTSVS